jgi:hypothetical protein
VAARPFGVATEATSFYSQTQAEALVLRLGENQMLFKLCHDGNLCSLSPVAVDLQPRGRCHVITIKQTVMALTPRRLLNPLIPKKAGRTANSEKEMTVSFFKLVTIMSGSDGG